MLVVLRRRHGRRMAGQLLHDKLVDAQPAEVGSERSPQIVDRALGDARGFDDVMKLLRRVVVVPCLERATVLER